MDEALTTGKDIVFDSSMATKNVGKYREYANRARRNGYKVYGIISDVSELTANERARKRADIPTKVILDTGAIVNLPGRLTTSDYIHDCAENLTENLNTYLGESLYDQCIVYDNNAPVPVPKSIHKRVKMPDGTFITVDESPKSSAS